MKYSDKYGYLSSLLHYFLILGEEEEPHYNDEEIIKAYVYGTDILERQPHCKMPAWQDKKTQKILIQRTLDEAKEVLKLDPFPEDWIVNISNHCPTLKFESYKQWMEWVVTELEKQFQSYIGSEQ